MTNMNVTLRGPLFTKKIDDVIAAAIVTEALEKIGARIERPGRGMGRKRNKITTRYGRLVLTSSSTLRNPGRRREAIPSFGRGAGRRPNPEFNPRVTGSSWVRKHIGDGTHGKGIIGSMAPHVLRKTAARIVAELG